MAGCEAGEAREANSGRCLSLVLNPALSAWRKHLILTRVSALSLPPFKGYTGTSDQYIDRNIQFAIAAARGLVGDGRVPSARILVPDAIELKRAQKLFSAALVPGVTLGHLREASPSGLEAFARAFGGGRGGGSAKPPPAGLYLVVNASTIELPDVEAYTASLSAPSEEGGEAVRAEDVPAMVLWNLELDTLRADLGKEKRKKRRIALLCPARRPSAPARHPWGEAGPSDTPGRWAWRKGRGKARAARLERDGPLSLNLLPLTFSLSVPLFPPSLGLFGFPGKDLQYRFLSRFTPAFYIRPRDYSKTVPTPPFLINYSGALFRAYPGPWQVMLKQDGGAYACVAEDRLRYTLGEAKDEMAGAMGIGEEVMVGKGTGKEGSANAADPGQSNGEKVRTILTRGVRQSPWWEDAFEEELWYDWRA